MECIRARDAAVSAVSDPEKNADIASNMTMPIGVPYSEKSIMSDSVRFSAEERTQIVCIHLFFNE